MKMTDKTTKELKRYREIATDDIQEMRDRREQIRRLNKAAPSPVAASRNGL